MTVLRGLKFIIDTHEGIFSKNLETFIWFEYATDVQEAIDDVLVATKKAVTKGLKESSRLTITLLGVGDRHDIVDGYRYTFEWGATVSFRKYDGNAYELDKEIEYKKKGWSYDQAKAVREVMKHIKADTITFMLENDCKNYTPVSQL